MYESDFGQLSKFEKVSLITLGIGMLIAFFVASYITGNKIFSASFLLSFGYMIALYLLGFFSLVVYHKWEYRNNKAFIEQYKNGMYGTGKEEYIIDYGFNVPKTYIYFDAKDSPLPKTRDRLNILYDYLKTIQLEDVNNMFCYGLDRIEHGVDENDPEEYIINIENAPRRRLEITSYNLTEDKIRILIKELQKSDIEIDGIKFDLYSESNELIKTLSLSDL